MGHCRTLAIASSRGQRVHQVTMKVLKRYLHAMDLMLANPSQWIKGFITYAVRDDSDDEGFEVDVQNDGEV